MNRTGMCLADWHAYIESVPLTSNQQGRIMAEWERLGLAGDEHRAERLTITAVLAESGELDSTRDLTQGQAGKVVRALAEARSRDDLATAGLVPRAAAPPCTLADLLAAIAQAAAPLGFRRLAVPKQTCLRPLASDHGHGDPNTAL